MERLGCEYARVMIIENNNGPIHEMEGTLDTLRAV